MASMFDGVTGRYDLLNRLMTLGQDGHWRTVLARAVPLRAITVLDLCTGNGVSLRGLTQPGRLVVGLDVSLGMLEQAAATLPNWGWAPRLVGGDAFRLPFRDGSIEAITVGFGVRNLRPRRNALAEMRRVLVPGGVLGVLEACAPREGAFAPFHRFHLRHVVPLLGRLSPDPSAYRYLSESIFEFGDGRPFEADLAAEGFTLTGTRSFLLGATRLWVARAPEAAGATVQDARAGRHRRGELPSGDAAAAGEGLGWSRLQLVVSASLTVALA
ncbi:MAG TPA: ubiquinone/menaquinone biosynthesis methyltransferase, partial [Planctomycetota bacterium]|nr:ubiquinone/menaquinone biosynthesis methyltransferase [Planctomycetota bacterium]